MTDTMERKIIILHNFQKDEYTKFLAVLEDAGLSSKTIVAITTPTTLNWKLVDLLNELMLEDDSLKGKD